MKPICKVGSRVHPLLRSPRLCVSALSLVLLSAAAAQAQRPLGLGSDLRLNGIVDPAPGAATLGTIKIRAGDMVRKFGVLRAQTAQVEGMSLFNRSELHPEQLLLRASKDQLDVFRTAPPGAVVQMLGRYQGDDYLLATITVAPTPAAGTPGP
jgi:hypothetical protein